jgi:hypothetical protein
VWESPNCSTDFHGGHLDPTTSASYTSSPSAPGRRRRRDPSLLRQPRLPPHARILLITKMPVVQTIPASVSNHRSTTKRRATAKRRRSRSTGPSEALQATGIAPSRNLNSTNPTAIQGRDPHPSRRRPPPERRGEGPSGPGSGGRREDKGGERPRLRVCLLDRANPAIPIPTENSGILAVC